MKKIYTLIIALLFACAFAAPSFACEGPNCSAEGNFDISVGAAGGGIDAAGKLIPNGAAGGIGVAGGIGAGEATGEFTSFKFFRKTITLGESSAGLSVTAGGYTNTYAYTYHPCDFALSIGVGSRTDGFAQAAGSLGVKAVGLAHSAGAFGAVAGQGSLNGSLIGPSPLHSWDSKGISAGAAGQGSIGGVAGYAATGLYGDAYVAGEVGMYGGSYSESYRGIDFNNGTKTETMGTNVGAGTTVFSSKYTDTNAFATGDVVGGFAAGGFAASKTVQVADGGIATASALGTYSGSGELGCNFNGSAQGYTQTSATTARGYTGSIMTSSAGMKVSNSPVAD